MPITTPLLAVVPAGVLAAILVLAAWRPWKPGKPGSGWWGSALALGLGYTIADRLVWKNFPLPPAEDHRWLPIAALLGAGFGLAEPWWRGRPWRGYAMAGLAAVSVLLLRLHSVRGGVVFGDLLFLAAFVAAFCILFQELDTVTRTPRGAVVAPISLCSAAAGAALVTIQSHSASLGMTAASISAVLGVLALVSIWRPNVGVPVAAMPCAALLIIGVLVTNTETYIEAKVLVFLAALAPALLSLAPIRKLPLIAAAVLCVAVAGGLCVAALHYTASGYNFGETEE